MHIHKSGFIQELRKELNKQKWTYAQAQSWRFWFNWPEVEPGMESEFSKSSWHVMWSQGWELLFQWVKEKKLVRKYQWNVLISLSS